MRESTTKKGHEKARDLSNLPPGCEPLIGKAEISLLIGVSTRTLQTMLATGDFPPPDCKVGLFPRWKIATYNGWLDHKCSRKER